MVVSRTFLWNVSAEPSLTATGLTTSGDELNMGWRPTGTVRHTTRAMRFFFFFSKMFPIYSSFHRDRAGGSPELFSSYRNRAGGSPEKNCPSPNDHLLQSALKTMTQRTVSQSPSQSALHTAVLAFFFNVFCLPLPWGGGWRWGVGGGERRDN